MLLATAATLLLTVSPARPALHLLPELALSADEAGLKPDRFRNSINPWEAVGGMGIVAAASLLEMVLSLPLMLVAIGVAALGDDHAVPQTFALLLGLQLAVGPLAMVAFQTDWAKGVALAGSSGLALVLGYVIEAAAAVCVTLGLVLFTPFWAMLGAAFAGHLILMPLATSLGLHLDLSGRPPPPEPAPPAEPPPVQVPLLRISF